MPAEREPRDGSPVTQGEPAPGDRVPPQRDVLSEQSERAHQQALKQIHADPVLANNMEALIESGGKDPFYYQLWRKRTGAGLSKPAERPRGGTQPNLPSAPSEPRDGDTLVEIEPPVALPASRSRTGDTEVLPRVAKAKRRRAGVFVGVGAAVAAVVALVIWGAVIWGAVIWGAGGEETQTHGTTPSASAIAAPVTTSASPPSVTASAPPAPASAVPTSDPTPDASQTAAPSATPSASAKVAAPPTKSAAPSKPAPPKPPATGPSSLGGSEPPF